MSETREFDGPNWRDNPDEYKPPVRRSGSHLGRRIKTARSRTDGERSSASNEAQSCPSPVESI